MKHKLRIVLVGLMVSVFSQATFAQYAASVPQVEDIELTTAIKRDGQHVTNVGKTIMLTGASVAMTGFVMGTMNTILGNGDNVSPLVLCTAIGCYYGGLVTLVGLPFYFTGKAKMKKNAATLMTISSEGQRGYVTNVEAGFGLANTVSLDVVRGYNFNEHLFVGGGVGCSAYLFSEVGEDIFDYMAVPAYANIRLTGGNKRVTPYVSGRLGCTLNKLKLYSGIEFGANIRSAAGSQNEAWWIGVKSDCVGFELQTMGLTVGKSF
jgi:hypothetical protein